MKVNDIIKNPILKKSLGIAGVVVAGIAAMSNAMSDQKREQEIEELKEAVKELQQK